MKTSPASPEAGSEATAEKLGRSLGEIARLLESSRSVAEFAAEFVPQVLSALSGIAAVLWERDARGEFRLDYQVGAARVGFDDNPQGKACHAELLKAASRKDRPLWAPPHSGSGIRDGNIAAANLSAWGVILTPILVEKEVAGILEVWLDPTGSPEDRKRAAHFLAEAGGIAAAYLHKTQWQQLQGQQQLWGRLEAFACQIHKSLNAREVACLVANEGRLLVGCDQLSVAFRRGRKVDIEAVSGATCVERASRQVRALAVLCDRVLAWGGKLLYQGTRDDTLPPDVLSALDAYLAESPSKLLLAWPLQDDKERTRSLTDRPVLVAECFPPSLTVGQLEERMAVLSAHAGPALFNAEEYRRVTAPWPTRLGRRVRELLHGRRWARLAVIAATLLTLVGALVLIPAPLRIAAKGQLLPKDRQVVYAPLSGKIIEAKVQHGDRVQKAQELLFLEDLETQLKVEQLNLKVNYGEQRLAVLGEQLAKATSPDDRNALLKERINQDYELRKNTLERDLLLRGGAVPRKTPVVAPLCGRVLTFDTHEALVGKTVKPGDALLRIARTEGPWEIEIDLPEGQIAEVREAFQRSGENALDVDLLLASQPLQTYKGRLWREGLGGETIVKDNAVVLPARVQVTDSELLGRLEQFPAGLEVRARISCGSRSIGHVWFSGVLEFLYEHLLF